MSEVVFERVRRTYGEQVAVEDLDLVIRSGEFMSLLGPSGCGKTTTLRMLAGLDHPTSGEIRIGGRVVNDVPPAKRDIAMVFQSYALYPHMTVAQNIAYPLRKRRVPRPEREERVRRTAALLQLDGLMGRKPRQLSGGQQQRVALGRALVRDPAVFLLDEPLSNLDAKLRAYMRAELIELHARLGRTMVYVTHDQLEAMTMSDRIAVLAGGVLQQCGTPDEVYRRPVNTFVAGFVGTPSMNFIEVAVRRLDDGLELSAPGLSLRLPHGFVNWPQGAAKAAREATLGVRPEDVLPGPKGAPAVVKVVEPTGHECIVLFALGDATIVARLPPDIRFAAGETVHLAFRPARLHLFDKSTGRRMNTDVNAGAEPGAARPT